MWEMLPSMRMFVEIFMPVFTVPSWRSWCDVMVAMLMTLGPRTMLRIFLSGKRGGLHDYSGRHGQDTYYNLFERSVWSPLDLMRRTTWMVFKFLLRTSTIKLVVDDTLLHKRGIQVFGKGWFRDAVASTKKRVATASGHNWVVLAAIYECQLLPLVIALPIMARLHVAGPNSPSCAALAREMIVDVMNLYPDLSFLLLGDGGYSNEVLLKDLPDLGKRINYIGRIRADAVLHDNIIPKQPKGKRGPKPTKGPKLPKPSEMARQPGSWQTVTVKGAVERVYEAISCLALYPTVLGQQVVRVIVVRDPEAKNNKDRYCYLICTDISMSLEQIVNHYSHRWAIETLFKACKQIMKIGDAQHYCQRSVETFVPCVLTYQAILQVWYILVGKDLPEAQEIRDHMGEWDTEWSLANMLRVFRRATINQAIKSNSGSYAELLELVKGMRDWVHLSV